MLFLKMADEKGVAIPTDFDWKVLKKGSGQGPLLHHYAIPDICAEKPDARDILTQAMRRSTTREPKR